MGRVRKLATGWKGGFAALIAIGAATVIAAHASAASGSLSIGDVTLLPGEDAQLQLHTAGVGAPGLGAWLIDIEYNAAVVPPTSCAAGAGGFCNVAFGSSTVRVAGADANGLLGDITLATLRIRCDHEGATALAITAIEFADSTNGAPQPIDVSVHHGSINCLAPVPPPQQLRGDANCDGVVNSVDALIVLQFVAALRLTVPCPDLADYDQNGHITSIDAALILQHDARLI